MALADNDWVVRLQTMAAIRNLPLNYKLTKAMSENLNSDNWTLRMMALYLNSKTPNPSFQQVLDWTVKYDTEPLVQQMALALGAVPPKPVETEPSQPAEPNKPNTSAL